MKKIMVLYLAMICLFVVSCDKDRCVTCDDPPVYFDSYIPYTNNDTILKFINERNDTLKSSINVARDAVKVGILDLWSRKRNKNIDAPCQVSKKLELTNNLINGVKFDKEGWMGIEVVESKFDMEGWYDAYSVYWQMSTLSSERVYTDAVLINERIDFRGGYEMDSRIEVFYDRKESTKWCSRFVIERDKGLVEFDDVINNCTWKLVE